MKPKPRRRLRSQDARPIYREGRTRPPMARMMQIHEVVSAHRFPNCTSLARELGVDRKTILRDVSWMRDEFGMPLEYHQVQHGYYYTKPVHELPLMRLTREDVMALYLMRRALEPLEGTRLHAVMAQSLSRLAAMCPGEVSFSWEELAAAFSVRNTGAVSADLAGFGELLDAVLRQREVMFDYVKLGATRAERRAVRPYHVGQMEQGWYLIGHDVKRRGIRTFALQRMTALEVSSARFERPADFDVREYLGGSFGVWAYEEGGRVRHEVRIEFTGYAARVVAERRWHATQEITLVRAGTVELRMRLAGLEEVMRWVLSWGSKARVMAPLQLQEMVQREITAMSTMAKH